MSQKTDIINQEIFKITGGFICFNSLTIDNDISFSKHQELSEMIKAPIYFCHPYHSWEKGGVENLNKLIRRYIPKKTDISQLGDEFIQTIEDKLNHKPRKCLNFKTPYEVMLENNQF
ncbi:MAG: IS30 family transposase, partial [Patescibacteria group bacterium]